MGLMDTQELDDSVGDFYDIQEELSAAPRPRAHCHSQIADFYKGRSVFITGASGFIGKVLIEKLLRTCPDIKRIFVLIRPKWSKRPEERLSELLACPLFDAVREPANLAQRVVVVEGDVTQQNLGLSGQNLLRLTKEVSVIVHSAATVKFDEPLKQSVAINIAGTKNMIEFCRRCPQLASLVHVSTAYANCDKPEIDEHVYPLAMDPEKLIQMADWLDLETLQELKKRLLGERPNTYTYTKALAEWLLVKSARDLPVVICRPSIVVASRAEPFKGWIDNVNGPTGVVLGAGKGLIRSMYAENSFVADLVPVDTVINLVISLGWFAHINKNQKHLNEQPESFTEGSLLSGGPSSVAGSSSASTTGGDDSASLDLEQSARTKELTQEAAAKLHGDTKRDQAKAKGLRRHRVVDGSSSSSMSTTSTPSLSGEDELEGDDEEEVEEAEAEAQVEGGELEGDDEISNRHALYSHHHHHMQHQDDGYGSRSDYANSISSSDSSSMGLGQKRRSRRHLAEKPIIKISSICESPKSLEPDHDKPTTLTTSDNANISDNNNKRLADGHNQVSSSSSSAAAAAASCVSSELETKLKQFRQLNRSKLIEKELPEELADIPVFHCTSGAENPITWGRIQLLVLTALAMFPSISTYRYPCGSFTNNKLLDDFYRLTLHYIPGYIADALTRLVGGKPVIVKIFKKFDQAANVLKAFTSKQWRFNYDNKLFLMQQLMNEEDRRLFNCDISQLDWDQYMCSYVIGVRKFLLKEPMTNLDKARKNVTFVYYRNLSLQVLFLAAVTYYTASMFSYFTNTTSTSTTTTTATITTVPTMTTPVI